MDPLTSKTFCVAPFTHLATKTDGSIKACCRSLPSIANIKNETLLQAWNNTKMRQLRQDLLNGVKNPRCNACWNLEAVGSKSLRQQYNDTPRKTNNALNNIKVMNDDYSIPVNPTWIEFKLNNLCNFKCRMCHPKDSTRWAEDYKKIEHLHNENWNNDLNSLNLNKIKSLNLYNKEFFDALPELVNNIDEISFAGGEPLLDDGHYEILKYLLPKANQITLSYATNMSILSNKKNNVLDFWPYFKKIILAVSLDGPPTLNEYVRSGADSNVIQENINKLQTTLTNISIIGHITVQALNIYYVPETLDWFKKMKVQSGVHFVTFPEFLDARIWNSLAREEIKQKLNDFLDKKHAMSDKSNDVIVLKQVINFFNGKCTYSEKNWKKFIEYNNILDLARNETSNEFEFLKKWMK